MVACRNHFNADDASLPEEGTVCDSVPYRYHPIDMTCLDRRHPSSHTHSHLPRPKMDEIVQEVSCDASGGTFTLNFDGAETDSIIFDADQAAVISALEELSTISEVNVTFLDGVSQACQAYPSALGFNVTFLEATDYRGDVPLMTSNIDNLEVITLSNSLACSMYRINGIQFLLQLCVVIPPTA